MSPKADPPTAEVKPAAAHWAAVLRPPAARSAAALQAELAQQAVVQPAELRAVALLAAEAEQAAPRRPLAPVPAVRTRGLLEAIRPSCNAPVTEALPEQ
jgi:hypothetical protein